MDLKEIQERNYQATVKRGLISNKTTIEQFLDKIFEELEELDCSLWDYTKRKRKKSFCKNSKLEMADIILTVLAMAKHYDIDIQKALEEKTIINENRANGTN